MINVNYSRKRNRFARWFGGPKYRYKTLSLPGSYEEVSGRQLIQLAPLLFKENANADQLAAQAFRILAGWSRLRFVLTNPEVIAKCLDLVRWVFDNPSVTKQLLPRYRGYYGPAAEFDNLKMKEFHPCELFYKQYVVDGQQEALDSLIAVLYRKPRWSYNKALNPEGDIRRPFNPHTVAYYTKKVKRWPDGVKKAIFFWYDCTRHELIESNPLVFNEPPKNGYESQYETGMYELIRNLAGDRLGTIKAIEEMEVPHAIMELGKMKEEEKFYEKELKNPKSS